MSTRTQVTKEITLNIPSLSLQWIRSRIQDGYYYGAGWRHWVIHRNLEVEHQAEEVRRVKDLKVG